MFALLAPSQVSLMASALVAASWVIGARLDAASPIGRGLAAPLAAGGMVFAAAWFAVVAVPVVNPSTITDAVLAIGSWGLIGG